MNRTLLWTLIIGGLIVLVIGLAKLGSSPSGGTSLGAGVSIEDQKKGAENPKVTIVEYSDFQCPACASMYPIMKELVEEFPNDLQVVYRHFPLHQIHAHAGLAARAAEAAGKQGAFWEMHDVLFNTQRSWSNAPEPEALFAQYAESLSLDVDQFNADIDSKEVKDKVTKDEASARGLRGTPTFFVNGKQIQNPGTYAGFKALVEEEIAQ